MIKTETKLGSNCSGNDGDGNRTLTLSNIALTQDDGLLVSAGYSVLAKGVDFTISHLNVSSIITFLNAVYNNQSIVVTYQQGIITPGSSVYCVNSDVYNKTGLSSTEVSTTVVDLIISDASAELEAITGRKFTDSNQITEYISGSKPDAIGYQNYPFTQGYVMSGPSTSGYIAGTYATTINLSNYPIQSLVSLQTLDNSGNVQKSYSALTSVQIAASTYSNTDLILESAFDTINQTVSPYGKIKLRTDSFPQGVKNIKAVYTYGYSSVPQMIKNLATCMAGIRAWIWFMGGSYNFINSYSIPQQNVNKGDFYQRAQMNIDLLQKEADRLLERIGRRAKRLFIGSGSDR